MSVQELYRNINYHSNPTILKFPNLHTLTIDTDGVDILPWLLDTEAPKLTHLTIVEFTLDDPRTGRREFQRTFEVEKHRIKILPTRLELQIKLTVPFLMCILKHWPQLQELTLYWDSRVKWDGKLLNALCSKDVNALCPKLCVLNIMMEDGWPRKKIDAWLKAARQILEARKDVLPLWKITLNECGYMPRACAVTIFDIE
jgi:hypothetical protein